MCIRRYIHTHIISVIRVYVSVCAYGDTHIREGEGERERGRDRERETGRERERGRGWGGGMAETHDFHDTKFVEIITKLVRTRAQNEQHCQRPALDLSGFRV
jgi:hypothetical protein